VRGVTREELGILKDLASPDMHVVDEARMEINERLVEQGRATERVLSQDDLYEYMEWRISEQGLAALDLFATIGERMLT
jgi:hypothetical protein